MTACQFIINWGTAVPVLSSMGTIVAALRAETPPPSPLPISAKFIIGLYANTMRSKTNLHGFIYFLHLISPDLDFFSLLDWCSVVSLIVAYFWS